MFRKSKENMHTDVSVLTLSLPDQIFNSPYCQPYNSCNISSGNLLLDQLIIPKLTFFFILITYLVVIVLIFWGEILLWSLMGVKGLRVKIVSGSNDFQIEPEHSASLIWRQTKTAQHKVQLAPYCYHFKIAKN